MSGLYVIRIQAWPYFLEEGRDVAQALAGPREQTFIVRADDIRQALAQAELFRDGMLTNPHVHCAPIVEVRAAGYDERPSFTRPCVLSVEEARQERDRQARQATAPEPPTPATDRALSDGRA